MSCGWARRPTPRASVRPCRISRSIATAGILSGTSRARCRFRRVGNSASPPRSTATRGRSGDDLRYRALQVQNGAEREVRGKVLRTEGELRAEITSPDGPAQVLLPTLTQMPVRLDQLHHRQASRRLVVIRHAHLRRPRQRRRLPRRRGADRCPCASPPSAGGQADRRAGAVVAGIDELHAACEGTAKSRSLRSVRSSSNRASWITSLSMPT